MGHQALGKVEWSAIVMMLLTVVLVISCSEGRAEAEKEPIVFSDLNWTSAQFQNRVAQYIVEKGYGYPTDVVFGATLPLLQGLRRGTLRSQWRSGCPTRRRHGWLLKSLERLSQSVRVSKRLAVSLRNSCLSAGSVP